MQCSEGIETICEGRAEGDFISLEISIVLLARLRPTNNLTTQRPLQKSDCHLCDQCKTALKQRLRMAAYLYINEITLQPDFEQSKFMFWENPQAISA